MKCGNCNEEILDHQESHSEDSGDYHLDCYKAWLRQSALDAGIPESVVDGKTKLRDHFSQEYIYSQCAAEHRRKL